MPYAISAGARIHYDVIDRVAPWEGRRDAILFHHGIGADPGIWTDWLPVLTPRYRVVRFDMRGYGRSDIPPRDFRWSLDLLTDDALAVADAAGVQRAHLVGESIGGTVVLNCAIRNPERVSTLTLSNGGHVGASIQRVKAWEKTIDEQGIKAWSDQFMRDRFHEGALDAARHHWYATMQETWPRDSILNAVAVLVGTDLGPRLPEVRCPTLLMHPDGSPFIPVGLMVDLYQRLPNARMQILAHAKHGMPFSHARECARLLRGFLDELTPSHL